MNALRTAATALAAGCIALGATPQPAVADFGAVTTDCRARFRGTWPPGDRFNGDVRPTTRFYGVGIVHHIALDGTQFRLQVETHLCRRDGGSVPQHGGANIADFTGHGTMRSKTGTIEQIEWEAHVEDRGAGSEREDFFALRCLDANGDEVYFDANYLATGDVVLTPVYGLTNPS